MENEERSRRITRALLNSGIARENQESIPNITPNAKTVLERRYLKKDQDGAAEAPDTMFRRVAENLSQADLNYGATQKERQATEDEFFDVMQKLELLPNSPTLMNAGRELQQLSACFVLPIDDDLDDIFSKVKETALIHKSGGGTGFSFNRLRPSGDFVKSTGGIASGPASFIRAFDSATDVVKQGGTRRGANMGILNVDHPDVMKFIRMKAQEGALENFNISIAVNKEFMEKVTRGEDYTLTNPRTGEAAGTLNAREVFTEIVEHAWNTGDPGLIFLDRINEQNPNPHLGMIESTNPCVTGDTWVMTREGPRQARSLAGSRQTLLVNGEFFLTGPEGFFSTGIKPVVRLRTQEGQELTLTQDHLVVKIIRQPHGSVGIRAWAPAGELRPGDRVALHDHRLAHRKGNSILPMSRISQPVLESLRTTFQPRNIVMDPRETCPSISLKEQAHGMLETAQRELLYLGIQSRIQVTAGPGDRELVIQGESLERLAIRVGSANPEEQHILGEMALLAKDAPGYPGRETYEATVESLEPAGEEEVWDVQVPGVNAFDANGIYVHNCGEQVLAPYESCNLGSINLARMVRFTDRAEIDWEKMERVIRTGVHMLDNVIDMNDYPLPQIEEASKKSRRIGLGVMGTADFLIQMGIRYDSEEALNLAGEVMSFIQKQAHQASHDLIGNRGPYPGFEGSTYTRPMRNTAPITIAPTGTISIIAGASSGIEPLFALAYTRNIMDQTRMREINPYFQAVANSMDEMDEEFMEELLEQVAQTGSLAGTSAPDWMKEIFRVSQDISPEWHVRMQAAFQEHTDNSVSKTINFPNAATREDIWKAYMLAHETGCKGITVYRDGSKAEQVLSTGQTQALSAGQTQALSAGQADLHTNGKHPTPRPRPRTMTGSTRRVRTGHGNMYITINRDEDGEPFEIFNAVGKAGGCDSAQIEAISRLVSMALRSNLDPQEISRQLYGITCCPAWDEGVLIRSIPDGIAIALSGNWKSPEQDAGASHEDILLMNGRQKCPDCNSPTHFQEGCQACTNLVCGWNRCS